MPSSSFFQRSSTTLVSALALLSSTSSLVSAIPAPGPPAGDVYNLDTSYEGNSFFTGFNFFNSWDPTHGFVTYLGQGDAQDEGLISANPGSAQLRVDAKTLLQAPSGPSDYWQKNGVGRKSVRIESQNKWTYGLFIADINHMPTTNNDGCGTWPAFWTLGPDPWPTYGEVDIIEGANDQTINTAAMHVAGQCTINNKGASGTLKYSNCNYNSQDPWGNPTNPTGCQVADTNKGTASYGAGFNSIGGGVYALEWTDKNVMNTYFFPRGQIPNDITAGKYYRLWRASGALQNFNHELTWSSRQARHFQMGNSFRLLRRRWLQRGSRQRQGPPSRGRHHLLR